MARQLVNCSFWVCLRGCVRKGVNISVNSLSEEDLSSPMGWASPNPLRGYIEQGGRGRGNLLSLPSAIGTPGSRVFGLTLNDTASFPGSPACRSQGMGLLGLHNHMSQFCNTHTHTDHLCFLWRTLTNTPLNPG